MDNQLICVNVGNGSDTIMEYYFYSNVSIGEFKKACKQIKKILGYDFLKACDKKCQLTKSEFDALLNLGYKIPISKVSNCVKVTQDGCFVFNKFEEKIWRSVCLNMFCFLIKYVDPSIELQEVRNKSELNIGGVGLF